MAKKADERQDTVTIVTWSMKSHCRARVSKHKSRLQLLKKLGGRRKQRIKARRPRRPSLQLVPI